MKQLFLGLLALTASATLNAGSGLENTSAVKEIFVTNLKQICSKSVNNEKISKILSFQREIVNSMAKLDIKSSQNQEILNALVIGNPGDEDTVGTTLLAQYQCLIDRKSVLVGLKAKEVGLEKLMGMHAEVNKLLTEIYVQSKIAVEIGVTLTQ